MHCELAGQLGAQDADSCQQGLQENRIRLRGRPGHAVITHQNGLLQPLASLHSLVR
jgi:hypothetical protein